jgi:UDPglucose 6-dehydrogenase
MVKIAQDAGYDFGLLKGVITVNDQQYGRIVDKIRAAAGGTLKGKKIASWGLTFKALTDDLRDSPAVEIVTRLLADGASVSVFDPTVTVAPKGLDAVTVCSSPLEACAGADVIAVLTEWDDFRWVSPVEAAGVVRTKQIVDARNLLDRSEWRRSGFEYQGIGR